MLNICNCKTLWIQFQILGKIEHLQIHTADVNSNLGPYRWQIVVILHQQTRKLSRVHELFPH